MGNKLYEESSIQAIANAIRSKLDTDATYKVEDMPLAVSSIPTGVVPTGTLNVASNGDYDVTNFAQAHVTVPQPSGNINILSDEYIKTVDVTQYTQATVSNALLEFSDMYYKHIETTTANLVLDYDATREVKELTVIPIAYDKDVTRSIISCFYRWSDRINDGGIYKHQIYTSDGTNPIENQLTGGYIPNPVFDTTNSTITIAGRNESYKFIDGGMFLIIITYAVVIPNEQGGNS